MSLNDIHSLSHTLWNCKHHIVCAPKWREADYMDDSLKKRLVVLL